MPYTQEHT